MKCSGSGSKTRLGMKSPNGHFPESTSAFPELARVSVRKEVGENGEVQEEKERE